MGSWASITAHARWTLRLLAVPDRLKVGSRKPELGTNRPTSWPAKDPLGRRLQDPRGLKQISNPQAGFSETTDVRKDSGGHWQILSISDLQVDLESVDVQAKPRDRRRIPKTHRFSRPQTLRQLRETTGS